MRFTDQEILRLASLAKIQIRGDEVQKFRHDLQDIFSHIRNICQVDTDGIEALTHPCNENLFLREDEVVATNPDDLIGVSPEIDRRLIVVPRIIGE